MMIKSTPMEVGARGEDLGRVSDRLAQTATSTFAIQVGSIGLSFVISVLLARLLGTSGYGAYSYAMAWLSLLEVPAVFGQRTLLVRNIAAYRAQSEWGLMAGLIKWANWLVLLVSIALVVLGLMVAMIVGKRMEPQALATLQITLFVLPLVAVTRLRQATLQGLHHVIAGQLPEKIVRPLSFILLVGGAYVFSQVDLNAGAAVGLNIIAMGIAFAVAKLMVDRVCPSAVKEAVPVYQTRKWVLTALPIMFIIGMNMINTRADILMLGALKGSDMVAIYTVADRGAQFVFFAMTAASVPLNPIVASLHASRQTERLQHIVTQTTRVVFGISSIIVLALTVCGQWFLLLFGSGFSLGYLALIILSSGQLFNVAMGPVGWLLVMTGNQRDAAIVIGICTALNIVLNLILIPEFGVEGAAAATTISTGIASYVQVMVIRSRLGIDSTVLGRLRSAESSPQ